MVEKLDRISRQLSRTREGLPTVCNYMYFTVQNLMQAVLTQEALLELSQLCMDGNFQSYLESATEKKIPPNSA